MGKMKVSGMIGYKVSLEDAESSLDLDPFLKERELK